MWRHFTLCITQSRYLVAVSASSSLPPVGPLNMQSLCRSWRSLAVLISGRRQRYQLRRFVAAGPRHRRAAGSGSSVAGGSRCGRGEGGGWTWGWWRSWIHLGDLHLTRRRRRPSRLHGRHVCHHSCNMYVIENLNCVKHERSISLRATTITVYVCNLVKIYYGRPCNRADHYIFILWFLLSSSSCFFFPRLISAVGDWMSTILPHMVWP